MYDDSHLSIYVFDNVIVVKNKNGMEKQFPRCNMTNIGMFILSMIKKGKLDELL